MNKLLSLYNLAHFPKKSRVHELPSFSTQDAKVYVKREDELGGIATGAKLRKYLSLIPYLAASQKEIAVLGGPYSNHVLALSLLLNEHQLPYTLFLQGNKHAGKQGNFFFTLLGYPRDRIVWIEEDLDFDQIVRVYEEKLQKRFTWVPVGGSCKHSLPGALTLAEDILRNEKEHKVHFDPIFTDAGTGFAASALLLGLGYMGRKTNVHIVQVAGGDLEFYVMLEECKRHFTSLFGEEAKIPPFDLLRPKKAQSFGSLSKEHLHFIQEMARKEGILLDPMYNAKLFLEAKEQIQEKNLKGNVLIIQSGGTLSLSGFADHFTI